MNQLMLNNNNNNNNNKVMMELTQHIVIPHPFPEIDT
jgi:hypothetical protein